MYCAIYIINNTLIQPIISYNGNLLSPLFIILKEINSISGPRVQETLFTSINVIVKASKSVKWTLGN